MHSVLCNDLSLYSCMDYHNGFNRSFGNFVWPPLKICFEFYSIVLISNRKWTHSTLCYDIIKKKHTKKTTPLCQAWYCSVCIQPQSHNHIQLSCRNCNRYTVILYSQWGLSLAPARSSSLAMGTLLVMMAMSRGRRPSLFGVLRSNSSRLYWERSSCTKSNSWCSTASNKASLLWNCDTKTVHMELKQNTAKWENSYYDLWDTSAFISEYGALWSQVSLYIFSVLL